MKGHVDGRKQAMTMEESPLSSIHMPLHQMRDKREFIRLNDQLP